MYTVVQPLGESRELRENGVVISRHRTLEAAEQSIKAAIRRVQKQPGQQHSYLDRDILDADGRLVGQ